VGGAVHPDRVLVQRVLKGDPDAVREFIRRVMPTIRLRVVSVLVRRASDRDLREEAKDLAQQVLLALFDRDAAVLRRWDPAGGKSLESYVGYLAERRAIDYLRSTKTRFGTEKLSRENEPEPQGPDNPERRTIDKVTAARVLDALRKELSQLGNQMFDLLYVELLETAEVCVITGMSPDAVQQWRTRLRRRIREILDDN
jgi:RNA polymerase sigma factor (sigma-70 family)